ncbi:MAG TPA: (2Fe-2S)-binding protein [Anaerolineales bacterium]|nr:(2Fe-2S)-binding protein [Anaerolineales bacterium]
MTAQRIKGIERETPVTITVNGQPVQAYAGESVAAALLVAGWRAFRRAEATGSLRGFFCGMGMCFDCLVTVDGVAVRGCMTEVREGCVVTVDC